MELTDLVGKVCRCSKGRPGLVTGRKELQYGPSWVGIALDDGPWQWASREPAVIAEDLHAFVELGDYTEEPPAEGLDVKLRRFATERQWETYAAWQRLGSFYAAGKALGVGRGTVSNQVKQLLRKAAQQGYSPADELNRPVPDGMTSRGVSTLVDADGNVQSAWHKTKQAGQDPDDAVKPLPIVSKVSTLYDAQGRVSQQWVATRREDEQRLEAWREAAAELVRELEPLEPIPAPATVPSELMVCLPVGDHHLGMLSWHEETGANWDLKIGEATLSNAFDYLIDAAPTASRAAVIFLGDFMHYDSFETVTPTSRNQLDSDTRFPELVRAAMRSMRRAIDAAARKFPSVHVIVEIGNHDLSSSIFLMEALAQLYERSEHVTVDTSPRHFHYFEHGACLVGVHHGHGVKKLEHLPGIMAADQAAAWGRTRYRYWWTGHVHHQRAQDFPGCSVESFRVLAPADAWADQSGYRAARDMKAVILHREFGEVARLSVNPHMFGG